MADQPLHGMGPQQSTQEAIHGLLSRLSEMSLRQHNLTVTFDHLRSVVEKVVERFSRFAFLLAVSGGSRHLLPYGLMQMFGLKGYGTSASNAGSSFGGRGGSGGGSSFPGYAAVEEEGKAYALRKEENKYRSGLIAQIRRNMLRSGQPASEDDLRRLGESKTPELESEYLKKEMEREVSDPYGVIAYAAALEEKLRLYKQYLAERKALRDKDNEDFEKGLKRSTKKAEKAVRDEVLGKDRPPTRQEFADSRNQKKKIQDLITSPEGQEKFKEILAGSKGLLAVDTETVGKDEGKRIPMQVGVASEAGSIEAWVDMPQKIKDLLATLRKGENRVQEGTPEYELLANMAGTARVMGMDNGATGKSMEALAIELGERWEKGLAQGDNKDVLADILLDIKSHLAAGGALTGHNLDFERDVLTQLLGDIPGLNEPGGTLDSVLPFTKKGGGKSSLDEVAKLLGVENTREGAHSAGADAELSFRIAQKLMELLGGGGGTVTSGDVKKDKEFSSDVSDLDALGEALDARNASGESFDTRTGGHEVDPEIVAAAVDAMHAEPVPVEVQPVPGAPPDDPFNGMQPAYSDHSTPATSPNSDSFNGMQPGYSTSTWKEKEPEKKDGPAAKRSWSEAGKAFRETVFGKGKTPEEKAQAKDAWNKSLSEKGYLGAATGGIKSAMPAVMNMTSQVMSSGNPVAWTTLMDSFTLLAARLSSFLLPVILEVIGGLQAASSVLAALSPEAKGWIAWIAKMSVVAAGVALAIAGIMAILTPFGLAVAAATTVLSLMWTWWHNKKEPGELAKDIPAGAVSNQDINTYTARKLKDDRVQNISRIQNPEERAAAAKKLRDEMNAERVGGKAEILERRKEIYETFARTGGNLEKTIEILGKKKEPPKTREEQQREAKEKQSKTSSTLLSLRALAASPQYSDIENVYKKVQMDVVGKDPMVLAIERVQRENALQTAAQIEGNQHLAEMVRGLGRLFGVKTD